MQNHFYTTSVDAWRAMLEAIRHAEKSVYLEMYIFEDNTLGFDFIAALEERARHGVKVVAVLDALGSFQLTAESVERLRRAGAEVLFFSYWFRRTHRKLLVLDERLAFVGGVNISNRFKHFNDLHVLLRGTVVTAIVCSFARSYHAAGGSDPALLLCGAHVPVLGKAHLWFVEHGLRGHSALRDHYEKHLDAAKRSIVLVTPYFVPQHWLIAALHRALARGVSVEILLPYTTDLPSIGRLNRYYATVFERLGARSLFSLTMNHAKMMLVDDRLATIGSQNLDALSFDWNVESGVFFAKPEMISELQRILSKWRQGGVPLSRVIVKRYWYDRIVLVLLRMLRPVL